MSDSMKIEWSAIEFTEKKLLYLGRVDVDHLDLPEVGLLEEFECVQVVALDEEVLGGVEIHALLPAGA